MIENTQRDDWVFAQISIEFEISLGSLIIYRAGDDDVLASGVYRVIGYVVDSDGVYTYQLENPADYTPLERFNIWFNMLEPEE